MSRIIATLALLFSLALTQEAMAVEKKYLTLELESGPVKIELLPEIAPKHVERVVTLAERGAYDNVAFHRVIEGFMAQTGDVEFGEVGANGQASPRAGTGGSDMPDLPAEFSDVPFERGVVGMARSQNPNSANSQFFIMFAPAPHLNGQYTVLGRVVEGMEHIDQIKRGSGQGGTVSEPDRIVKVTVTNE
jgi:cyclophilin family peptidyl-prolyl cis-trans isomerase